MSWPPQLTLELAQSRQPLSFHTFFRELLPPLLCYYATAILVLGSRTLTIRLALLPITIWTTFRAVTRVDLVADYSPYENLVYVNQGLVLLMTVLVLRACTWTFQPRPYTRKNSSTSKYIDAANLCFNLRGIGWSWAQDYKLPTETRNTSSVPSFLFSTAVSLICNLVLCDLCHFIVQSFGLNTFGSAAGGTIFDSSLDLLPRLQRASIICFLTGATFYYALQTAYHLVTFPGILILRQSPEDWPPLFAEPWLSTSLTQFWSYRWHQLFRDNFVSVGGKPAAYITRSRVGGVLGAFFVSGILHYLGAWGMGRGGDFIPMVGYFMMMGVGIILEYTWRAITGYRVQGVIGWAWTFFWLVSWGTLIVDAWCMKGLGGSQFFLDGQRPAVLLLERLKMVVAY